jgi:basic amino acid/polyamine antiporter, APA family
VPDSPSPPPSPEARLSSWHAGAIVVGSMIGTGVFTTSGLLLDTLGSRATVLVVWALGGLCALAGAAVYAELGAMLPRVGGEYVYLSHAFSPAVGFLSGWIALLVGFAAPIAAGAAAFARYLEATLPGVNGHVAGALLIIALTAVHAREVVFAGRLQLGVTVVNVVALVVFAVGGGWALLAHDRVIPVTNAPAATGGGLAIGLVLVSYSYAGWNGAAYLAGEVKNPQRSLPRALCLGCVLVTAVYLAVNAVFVAAVPREALAGKIEIAHLAAEALFGPTAARALSALITVIVAASLSAIVMTGPRVYLAMAEDGLFWRVCALRNQHGAPSAGVLLQGALALVFYLTAAFEALLLYVGFTLSLVAAATVVAAIWLRHKDPDRPRPFRTPLWPLPPIVFLLLSLFALAEGIRERPRETLAGLATIAAGALAYWLWRARASTTRSRRKSSPSDQA